MESLLAGDGLGIDVGIVEICGVVVGFDLVLVTELVQLLTIWE